MANLIMENHHFFSRFPNEDPILEQELESDDTSQQNKSEYDKMFAIFKEECTYCTDSNDYQQCAAIQRIGVALNYYATMNVKNSKEKFCDFVNNIYRNAVNDNNHLMMCHSEQLQQIRHCFFDDAECAMNGCASTQRHFGSESVICIKDDQMINFYVNLFDALHFWIFHCFDSGFRVKQSEKRFEDEIDDTTLSDAEFARINAIIRKTDFETASFEKPSQRNNTKFVLAKAEKGDTTFSDELYKYLSSELIDTQKLREAVDREAYDSESIKMDISIYGNIANDVNNDECGQSILNFIKGINIQSETVPHFAEGLRFYYWEYYEHLDVLPANEQIIDPYDNKHDHGGYKVSELVVKPKYDSFKEEAANYQNLNIDEYRQAYAKATIFMKSDKVKEMSAKYTDPNNNKMFLHYDIAFGALVSFYHILSLIFYTDYSCLSSVFSATFRQIHSFEMLNSIKQRNSLYFWMSKALRELVELFGQCSHGDEFQRKNKPLDPLKGRFYCGMNIKLNVDSFAMRLNSPTSTSKQLSVAIKFSGPEGVVITFNNRGDARYEYLRAIHCPFISGFPEEDECLFFGGFYRIKVVNPRLMETKQNVKPSVNAVFEFDQTLNESYASTKANDNYRYYRRKLCIFIIQALINIIQALINIIQALINIQQFVINCCPAFKRGQKRVSWGIWTTCMEAVVIVLIITYFMDSNDMMKIVLNILNDGFHIYMFAFVFVLFLFVLQKDRL